MSVAEEAAGSDVLRAQTDPAFGAWVSLLRARAAAVRHLSGELQAEYHLTIADYDALLHLAQSEGQRLRRVDLASRLVLTPSGVTRLLQGLEDAGLVEKGACPEDARVSYAVLTDAGRETLESASCAHVAAVKRLFEAHFTTTELERLAELLRRLPEATDHDRGVG